MMNYEDAYNEAYEEVKIHQFNMFYEEFANMDLGYLECVRGYVELHALDNACDVEFQRIAQVALATAECYVDDVDMGTETFSNYSDFIYSETMTEEEIEEVMLDVQDMGITDAKYGFDHIFYDGSNSYQLLMIISSESHGGNIGYVPPKVAGQRGDVAIFLDNKYKGE